MPSFQDYIEQRHKELDRSMTGMHERIFTSKKQYTRQIKRPELLSLDKVLRMAGRLGVHPLSLHEKFNAGKLTITKDDIYQLERHYSSKPNAQHHAYQDRLPKPPDPPRPTGCLTCESRGCQTVLQD